MKPVQITCDALSDLTEELYQKYRIRCILHQTGTNQNKCADEKQTIKEYSDCFEEYIQCGFQVVHISPSASLSPRCHQAKCAARNKKDVFVVDSQNISAGLGHLAILAAELSNAGLDAQEIALALEDMKQRLDTSFLFSSAKRIHKGGFHTAAALFLTNLMKRCPELLIEDGKIRVGHKFGGSRENAILQYVRERLEGETNIQHDRIFVLYSGISKEEMQKVEGLIRTFQPMEEIIEMPFGSASCGCAEESGLGLHFLRNT